MGLSWDQDINRVSPAPTIYYIIGPSYIFWHQLYSHKYKYITLPEIPKLTMASSVSPASNQHVPPVTKDKESSNWADLPPELTFSILIRIGSVDILKTLRKYADRGDAYRKTHRCGGKSRSEAARSPNTSAIACAVRPLIAVREAWSNSTLATSLVMILSSPTSPTGSLLTLGFQFF